MTSALQSSEMTHLLLLLCVSSPGFILTVYGEDKNILAVKGGSVELNVQMNLMGMDIEYIFWRFNLSHSVVRYSNDSKNQLKVYQEYEHRVGMDPKTYTLVLKDLKESDNGIYTAKITDHRGYEKDVAKHSLVVHEAVPDLEFSMTLLYFNSTEGYCNVSVSCSAMDSHVSYTCDLEGCTEDQTVLLRPHLVMAMTGAKGVVACNASNLVSAKSRWAHMSDVCIEELISESMSLLRLALLVLDITTPILLLCLLLYVLLIRPRHIGGYDTKLKTRSESVELLHVHESEDVLKDPALPDYLKGAAVYSISQGRKPALPALAESIDTYTLARL